MAVKRTRTAQSKAEIRGLDDKRKAMAKLLAMEDKLNKKQAERLKSIQEEIKKADERNKVKREEDAIEKQLRDKKGILPTLETSVYNEGGFVSGGLEPIVSPLT